VKRSTIFTILKLVFAACLIWFVVDRAGGTAKIANMLQSMDRQKWLLGLGVMFGATCLSMLRWHYLMKSVGLNSTPLAALRLGYIGVFFNNVVPGLTGGDLVKAVYVTRENPNQRSAAVVSVIVDRIIGIVALALVAAVVIPFNFAQYGQAAIGIYGFLLVAAIAAVLTLSRRAKTKLRSLLEKFGFNSATRGAGALSKIEQAVSMYRDRFQQIVVALFMSVAVHLLIIFAISIFAEALIDGMTTGLPDLEPDEAMVRQAELEIFGSLEIEAYCSIIPIIMIISALPVAPAGWGVGEVAFLYFFGEAGVAETDATSLSVTFRLTSTLISLLGGVFLLLDRKRVLEATSEQAD
jgi:uncharacterized protein (TIRG00374 family)